MTIVSGIDKDGNQSIPGPMCSEDDAVELVFNDREFEFTSNTPLGNFVILTEDGMGMTMKTNLDPGVYNVAEIIPDGWDLTDSTCDDGSPVNAIDISQDEFVTCTFKNVEDICVDKTKEEEHDTGDKKYSIVISDSYEDNSIGTTDSAGSGESASSGGSESASDSSSGSSSGSSTGSESSGLASCTVDTASTASNSSSGSNSKTVNSSSSN